MLNPLTLMSDKHVTSQYPYIIQQTVNENTQI